MKNQNKKRMITCLIVSLFLFSCGIKKDQKLFHKTMLPLNMIDYNGTPDSKSDKSLRAFSDQGAWFGYGFPSRENKILGFSGPFLMTFGRFGEWSSDALSQLELVNSKTNKKLNLNDFLVTQKSYNSHLTQVLENGKIKIEQNLFYNSSHSVIITTQITNLSKELINLKPVWKGRIFQLGLRLSQAGKSISLISDHNTVKGIIKTHGEDIKESTIKDASYSMSLKDIKLKTNETQVLTISHTYIFPEYDAVLEQQELEITAKNPFKQLYNRIKEKENELSILKNNLAPKWQDTIYEDLIAKTILTFQNNTRIASGGLKHAGIFPSYRKFLGFWAWDSWKHSAAVGHYDIKLAKNQIRAMYDSQLANGFIPDCIFRDSTVRKNNYRSSKPPLSAWAVWKVYQNDQDTDFIREMYPKIIKQHNWWYIYRDYDKDGICEYGSNDGTLKAAKWESGMDNAVRFDASELLKNGKSGFSLSQESVDLNTYLYAEKKYLSNMAEVLKKNEDKVAFNHQAAVLKTKIQNQFFNKETGWFYDTSIDGKIFIKVMACEGWLPLWAKVATEKQAKAVRDNMINPSLFNTKVPFQTLSANHPKFNPDKGYWRGPNWLDQAYFGVVGLHNYGYHDDADKATYKLIHNAEGLLAKGPTIRENYQPLTGKGLKAENFSWSAAHYLLLLLNK